jgi:flagellar hook protein FlgE
MLRGLTTAASGMLADQRLQQLLANNLANAETPGFKASDGALLAFPEQLQLLVDNGKGVVGTVGKMGTGVVFQEGVPLFLQGQLQNSGRNLDVAIVDNTPASTYAAVVDARGRVTSAAGPVTVGPRGRLEIGGVPLAVLGPDGQAIPGIYAVRNPAYTGQALYAANGMPDYDQAGNPSYVFADAQGNVVGRVGDANWQGAGVRIGSQADMGFHSFFAVDFHSPEGQRGIALTRDGHFDVDANNLLVDANGNHVLPIDANGMPMLNARIQINPNYTGKELFGPDGRPLVDSHGQPSYRVVDTNNNPLPQGRLGTVDADVTTLNPLGGTEYQVAGTLNPVQVLTRLRPSTASLKPGQLEQSNVDVTATMVQMMSVISHYEANQRVIQTYDSLLEKAVTDVGKVNA